MVRRYLILGLMLLGLLVGCGSHVPQTIAPEMDKPVSVLQQDLSGVTVAELDRLTPFITQTETGSQKLYLRDASRSGISAETLQVAAQLLRLNAQILRTARQDQSYQISDADLDRLSGLFQPSSSRSPDLCGGFAQPSFCPDRVSSGFFGTSEAAVIEELIGLGYSQTSAYASFSNPNDYTLEIPVEGCGCCAFRSQAIYSGSGSSWTYSTQGPEPNPEVLNYFPWPYWYWPTYNFWWHQRFC